MGPRLVLGAVFLLFVVSTRLTAQPLSDPGLGLGGSLRFSAASETSAATVFGQLTGRGRITGGLGVDVSLGLRQASYQAQGSAEQSVLEGSLTVSALVFILHDSRLQPHVLLGGGYHLVRNSGAVSGTEHLFAFHAGFGFEYRMKPRLTLIADARYVFLEAESVQTVTGQKAGYLSVGAGLLIHLR